MFILPQLEFPLLCVGVSARYASSNWLRCMLGKCCSKHVNKLWEHVIFLEKIDEFILNSAVRQKHAFLCCAPCHMNLCHKTWSLL